MASNLIEKLLSEAVQTGGTYAEFMVSEDKVAFICDGGTRRMLDFVKTTRKCGLDDSKYEQAAEDDNRQKR